MYFGPNLVGSLYAGIPDEDRAKRTVDTLENAGFGLSDENNHAYPKLRHARFRVLAAEILAGSGLDQHRLVSDAGDGTLRVREARPA